jgi:competence protein ComEA
MMLRVCFFILFLCFSLTSPLAFADSQQCESVVATHKPALSPITPVVNINTATSEQLSSQLKGVGKAKAAAIIEWRETNGKFSSLDDLDEVKGIGAGIIEKNKDKIVFDD